MTDQNEQTASNRENIRLLIRHVWDTPYQLLIISGISLFLGEMITHLFLEDFHFLSSRPLFALADALVTLVIFFPVMYFFSFRPMVRHIRSRRQVEQALFENQEFFRAILEDQTELLCRFNPGGSILFVNSAYLKFSAELGHAGGRNNFFDLFHPEDRLALEKRMAALDPERPVLNEVVKMPSSSGHETWLHWTVRGLFSKTGILISYQAVGIDITERERLVESLRAIQEKSDLHGPADAHFVNADLLREEMEMRQQAEDLLRIKSAALDAAASGIVITDPNGVVQWINPAFSQITGFSEWDMVGRRMNIVKSGWQDHEFYESLWQVIQSGRTWQGELINRRKNGRIYPEEQSIIPLLNKDGKITHFISVKQDISERKTAEENEQRYRDQLQALSHRLVEVQENERKTIARELHDETGQALVYLKFAMSMLKEDAGNREAVVAGVSDLEVMLDSILGNLHDLAVNLRPSTLDHFGLVPTLRQYIDTIRENSGLQVELDTQLLGERLPGEIEVVFYRVIQEGLTNVLRHAQATRVEVSLVQEPDQVWAKICDNGVGFDPDGFESTDRLGLFGIRERAEMFKGSLTIDSGFGHGTTLTICIPYEHQDTDR